MKRSTAALLALLVAAFLIVNNASFFYHPVAEVGDTASNSLSIIRAKHFAQLYGNYSRFGIYHPGPALFYVQACGESLFYDRLHICPAPHNAQRLVQLCLGICFFVAALRAFTLWLPRGPRRAWFLAGALAFAAFHFAGDRKGVFLSNWPPFPPTLLLLCLLSVGAAVAAGRGGELPFLTLSAGFLLHSHVAQPLFVFPLTLLAYAGLWWRCVVASNDPTHGSRWQRLARALGAGWRVWPRSHFLAVGLLVIFAVPLVIDVCRGADSNLTAILGVMHRFHGEHKTWLRSLLYFLQFGTRSWYAGSTRPDFGHYDRAGALAYLRAHAWIIAGWLGVAGVALWAVVRQIPGLAPRDGNPLVPGERVDPAVPASPREFLAWAGVFLGVVLALTLDWGRIQDGPMMYFNAYFNYGIYYFGALIALAVFCDQPFLTSIVPPGRWANLGARFLPACLVAAICAWQASALRLRPASDAKLFENVTAINAATTRAGPGGTVAAKFLLFQPDDWPYAVAVALELRRLGVLSLVIDPWKLIFGEESVWRPGSVEALRNGLQIWRLQPQAATGAGTGHPAAVFPLLPRLVVNVAVPAIDLAGPRGEAVIDCGQNGSAAAYPLFGWSSAEPLGTWNDGRKVLLAFHPSRVEGGSVELRVEANPFLAPEKGLSVQRLRVFFNGEALGDMRRLGVATADAAPLTFVIPAALWNRCSAQPYDCATLGFELPDAVTPASLDRSGLSQDGRLLGLWFRSLRFRTIRPASDPGGGS